MLAVNSSLLLLPLVLLLVLLLALLLVLGELEVVEEVEEEAILDGDCDGDLVFHAKLQDRKQGQQAEPEARECEPSAYCASSIQHRY